MTEQENKILVLGGGLTGLSAGCILSRAGRDVTVLESDDVVGGISKTIEHHGFRFDLGGHRFFSKDDRINAFVEDLMDGELIKVPRKSKIFLRGKYFDYPLKPANALFGLGIPVTLRILADYGIERIKRFIRAPEAVSLEDWVVAHFGRTMYNIYFKGYSEKVWGIACDRISAEWVSRRIRGLSLSKAVANAFVRRSGNDVPSLVDEFLYPELGIGRIAERLKEEIERSGKVFTNSRVERIKRSGFRVESVTVRTGDGLMTIEGSDFISSIPVTKLLAMFDPAPPEDIMAAASHLKFRDLVVVAVMINRSRVTDQTWIYIPEAEFPFGRIHEPTNWSAKMAPEGKTLIVAEFFSFKGDTIWNASDQMLSTATVRHLEQLGYIRSGDVLNSKVVRVPKAYPLFEVGYRHYCDLIYDYFSRFENLQVSGRSGLFQYLNMDHAIESGMKAAEKIMKNRF